MNIYFCPESVGDVFLHNLSQPLLKDAVVFNTVELVGWIELRLGLHLESVSRDYFNKTYRSAMKDYFKRNPINGISMCYRDIREVPEEKVFQWRCELTTANEEETMSTARMVLDMEDNPWENTDKDYDNAAFYSLLKAVVGIEEFYSTKSKVDFDTRLLIVDSYINFSKVDFSKVVIYLPCELDLLKPEVVRLLTKLRNEHGAQLVRKEFAAESCFNLDKVKEQIAAIQEEESGVTDAVDRAHLNRQDTTAGCADSGDVHVPRIQLDFSPTEYILTKMGERYPLTGGWGYSADAAVEILLENTIQSIWFEHWFIKFRTELELNGFGNKRNKYEDIECDVVKQSLREINGKKYDVISYTVKAISVSSRMRFTDDDGEEFLEKLRKGRMNGKECWKRINAVLMEDNNDANYSISYQTECFFDVSNFFGKF